MLDCQSKSFNNFPSDLDNMARMINLNNNFISSVTNGSLYFPYLAKLLISTNTIFHIKPGTFIHLNNLLVLDLSHNHLTELFEETFIGLSALVQLVLVGNKGIKVIEPGSFLGLYNIHALSLSHMHLTQIHDFMFRGLKNVEALDLSYNAISDVLPEAFGGLSNLKHINLINNAVKKISKAALLGVPSLTSLQSDHFRLCCLAEQLSPENCYPPQDPISSCEDLMNNEVLRVSIWILGMMACVGNIFVVMWRMRSKAVSVPDIIISNLALSDLMMGAYMLIIAGVDLYYKGIFIEFSTMWRESWLCKLAGFLATFSSEASVMFLCVLTVDRFINIMFPFSNMKFSKSVTKIISVCVWILGFVLSVVPFMYTTYFGNNYYGRSGVCMALPITNERPQGK